MTIYDGDIAALHGGPADLDRYRGSVALVVKVASPGGRPPQYAGELIAAAEKLLPR
jgi:glutathione peroxidase